MEIGHGFSRKPALIVVIATTAVLALNHLHAMDTGEYFGFAVFLCPMFLALGLGGLVDPRVLFAIGPRGKHLPSALKATGAVLAIAGLGVGGMIAHFVYGFGGK